MSVTSCYFLLLLPSASDRTGLTGTLLYRAICRRLQNQTFSFSKHFRRSVCVSPIQPYTSARVLHYWKGRRREKRPHRHTLVVGVVSRRLLLLRDIKRAARNCVGRHWLGPLSPSPHLLLLRSRARRFFFFCAPHQRDNNRKHVRLNSPTPVFQQQQQPKKVFWSHAGQ